jgi:sugar phosphate isomerase/epimerase
MLMAKRPHLSPIDYDARARHWLRDELVQHNLRGTVIAGYTNFTADLEHAEIPQREIQTLYVTELARLARDIGAPLVRIFTSYDHPALSHSKQWDLLVPALRECARRAGDFGVTLGVQNHHDLAVDHRSLLDLLREVDEPNCRAMFDAWAPALQGADLSEAARVMKPFTAHTTVADYQLRPRFKYNAALVNYEPQTPLAQAVPMGEGFIDYRTFLNTLEPASVAYEMCSPLLGGGDEDNLDRYARQFLSWMRHSDIQSPA